MLRSLFLRKRSMKREGLVFSEDFAAGGSRVLVLFCFVLFGFFLCWAFKQERAGAKSVLATWSSGCGRLMTILDSGKVYSVLNWPSVKFCVPYRLILQVCLCCGSGREDKDTNLAFGLKLYGKLVCSGVGTGLTCLQSAE